MGKLIINNVKGTDLKDLESPTGAGIDYIYTGFSRLDEVFEFVTKLKSYDYKKNILVGNGFIIVNRTDGQTDKLSITESSLSTFLEPYL